jgi:hypothetical protein
MIAGTLLWILSAACPPPAPVQGFQEQKLTASDAATGAQFGTAVAMQATTAVVGAPRADHSSLSHAGAAYVFTLQGASWAEQWKLTAGDAASSDLFGGALAIDGDTVVVGARKHDVGAEAGAGSAYVFVRQGTTWSEQAELVAADGRAGDAFGYSVAVQGDTVVVGAMRDDRLGAADVGSAYVFVRSGTTWTQQFKMTDKNPAAGDLFGSAVAIDGSVIAVGAKEDDNLINPNAGSVFVFELSGGLWNLTAKLLAEDYTMTPFPDSEEFGTSVALDGGTLFAGDPQWSVPGRVSVFTSSGSTWSTPTTLNPTGPVGVVEVGRSLGLSGSQAVTGQPATLSSGTAGKVRLFTRSGTTWSTAKTFNASDTTGADDFGWSVAIHAPPGTILVGAPRASHAGGSKAGAAYVFTPLASSLAYCTAGVSASGCSALLASAGTASATAPSGFDLSASGGEGAKDGLFFFGSNGRQANPWGNGTSFQCVVPPVKRAGLLSGSGTSGLCDGAFSQDLNALWCPTCPKPGHNPGAGATVQAQLWYRDPFSTSNQTTSLSDAIEFTIAP